MTIGITDVSAKLAVQKKLGFKGKHNNIIICKTHGLLVITST